MRSSDSWIDVNLNILEEREKEREREIIQITELKVLFCYFFKHLNKKMY